MSASEYADFLLAEELVSSHFDERFGDEWRTEEELTSLIHSAIEESFARHGYSVGRQFDDVAIGYIPWLLTNGGLVKEGDAYTGNYFKLRVAQKNLILKKYIESQSVAKRIRTLRSDALGRALRRLAEENSWTTVSLAAGQAEDAATTSVAIPASDRIVTLNHNQADEIVAATDTVIDGLQTENSIDGDAELRDRFLGQLRASRELVRAQSVRAYLLYESVVGVLGALIERYKDQAIAEAAKKLLDLLIERVFKS